MRITTVCLLVIALALPLACSRAQETAEDAASTAADVAAGARDAAADTAAAAKETASDAATAVEETAAEAAEAAAGLVEDPIAKCSELAAQEAWGEALEVCTKAHQADPDNLAIEHALQQAQAAAQQ